MPIWPNTLDRWRMWAWRQGKWEIDEFIRSMGLVCVAEAMRICLCGARSAHRRLLLFAGSHTIIGKTFIAVRWRSWRLISCDSVSIQVHEI